MYSRFSLEAESLQKSGYLIDVSVIYDIYLGQYLLLLEDVSVLSKAQLAEELWQVGAFHRGAEVTAVTTGH